MPIDPDPRRAFIVESGTAARVTVAMRGNHDRLIIESERTLQGGALHSDVQLEVRPNWRERETLIAISVTNIDSRNYRHMKSYSLILPQAVGDALRRVLGGMYPNVAVEETADE